MRRMEMGSMIESLKIALDMEKHGYDLYIKAAKRTSNKLGKVTLLAIAEKELNHIEAIKEFSKRNEESSSDYDKAIAAIDPRKKNNYVIQIMDKIGKELNKEIKPDSDLNKAYKIAMDLEKHSYDLYKKLANGSAEPKVKQFFEFLMGEENTHYELLSETLEYLDHPGDWFKEQERWIVEG